MTRWTDGIRVWWVRRRFKSWLRRYGRPPEKISDALASTWETPARPRYGKEGFTRDGLDRGNRGSTKDIDGKAVEELISIIRSHPASRDGGEAPELDDFIYSMF